jgi:hypothetical protein
MVIVIASSQGDSRILMQKLTRDRLQASVRVLETFVRFFSCSYICGDFEYESV